MTPAPVTEGTNITVKEVVPPELLQKLQPYCIFKNPLSEPVIFRIQPPSLTETDGKYEYNCSLPSSGKDWSISAKFWTPNAMMRPLPVYSSLVRFSHNASFPYELQSVSTIYDTFEDISGRLSSKAMEQNPFRFDVDLIAFMYPMPKSQALYIYMRNGMPYPTFVKDERASKSVSFGPNPLFVFTESSCNTEFPFPTAAVSPADLKFVPINGVCRPYLGSNPNVLDYDGKDPMDLASCTMLNTQIYKKAPKVSVKDLLQLKTNDDSSSLADSKVTASPSPKVSKDYKSPIIMVVFITAIVLLITVLCTTLILFNRRRTSMEEN
tara:strand:- start:123 stop:1091 length:969 start_codon:yes stop_codon:yes gene_type:complete